MCRRSAYGCVARVPREAGVRSVDLHVLIPRGAGLYGNVQHPPETLAPAKAAFIAC